jgi:hypothetical protein
LEVNKDVVARNKDFIEGVEENAGKMGCSNWRADD